MVPSAVLVKIASSLFVSLADSRKNIKKKMKVQFLFLVFEYGDSLELKHNQITLLVFSFFYKQGVN